MTKAHPHRQVNVHLDTVDDADVIERIKAQPSMVGYVRELVRRDIHDERLNCVALKTSELLDENAKLRELCRRFSEYVSHDRCEGCVVKRRCNDGEIDECWQMGDIRKLAHELGIEVDA